jgi:hypothetical protein
MNEQPLSVVSIHQFDFRHLHGLCMLGKVSACRQVAAGYQGSVAAGCCRTLVDFDLALVFIPGLLFGVSFGVMFNVLCVPSIHVPVRCSAAHAAVVAPATWIGKPVSSMKSSWREVIYVLK